MFVVLSLAALLGSASLSAEAPASPKNVKGEALAICSQDPVTGFYRSGRCRTGPNDRGTHVVCAEMTREFLAFTKSKGNDLSTPAPRYRFPGLEPGDRWCLCALRWREALRAGKAPPVILDATEASALDAVEREALEAHAR
jgi:hypothetical protein